MAYTEAEAKAQRVARLRAAQAAAAARPRPQPPSPPVFRPQPSPDPSYQWDGHQWRFAYPALAITDIAKPVLGTRQVIAGRQGPQLPPVRRASADPLQVPTHPGQGTPYGGQLVAIRNRPPLGRLASTAYFYRQRAEAAGELRGQHYLAQAPRGA
jgi:hypothetical protein